MIGTDLNLDIPSLSDTYSEMVAKTAVAFQAIEDSIADQATPAALNITGNLSIGGNHLTNVGGMILAAGNSPSAAGSVYYSGGNFYLRDATGIIQLTAAGAINVAGIGGIGGDYGGSNPATVNFDDASGEYRFRETSSPVTWADLVADDLVLMEGSAGTDYVRITTPASLAASYTLTLPAALPAANSMLIVTPAGEVQTYKGVYRVVTIPAAEYQPQASTYSFSTGGHWQSNGGSSFACDIPLRLPVGAVLQAVSVRVNKVSAGGVTHTLEVFRASDGTLVSLGSLNNTAGGLNTITVSPIAHTALSGSYYFARLSSNGTDAGELIYHASVGYYEYPTFSN